MRMRLTSQQDDATEGDDGVGTPASPQVKEVTEGNDSIGFDYAKGNLKFLKRSVVFEFAI